MTKLKSELTPKHGYAHGTRGAYLLEKQWIVRGGGMNAFEGQKAFPTAEIASINYQGDGLSTIAPEDGYICSGGNKDFRDIVNYTDDELKAAKGETWPRIQVTSGQEFIINWQYDAKHVTRGYNYWITKDGWNPKARITKAQLEDKPFCKDHYTFEPTWSYNDLLAPKTETKTHLPINKSGYHVMIVSWIIADTDKAFYQTFDLEFTGVAAPEPTVQITPSQSAVSKGEIAIFASTIAGGEGPFTYLWNLPEGLSVVSVLTQGAVEYSTDQVTTTQEFHITCTVTDKNGKTATSNHGILTVNADTTPELKVQITPPNKTVNKGENAAFATEVTGGEGAFTYLWTVPAGLNAVNNVVNQPTMEFNTDQVSETKMFHITCAATDTNSNTATSMTMLTVNVTTSEPNKCTDPEASKYPVWNSSENYSSTCKRVSYQDLVWSNPSSVNAGGAVPDQNPAWTLMSNVVLNWTAREYKANRLVNHNGSQWRSNQLAPATAEPGVDSKWVSLGASSCTPLTNTNKN